MRPTVAVFGVGHVGYELARILSRLEIQLHLSTADRSSSTRFGSPTSPAGAASVSLHHSMIGEMLLERLPRGSHILIMTHDHAEDFALCDAAIRTSHLGSIGLIGSSAKWVRFQAQLADAGHDAAAIAKITCPIGNPVAQRQGARHHRRGSRCVAGRADRVRLAAAGTEVTR